MKDRRLGRHLQIAHVGMPAEPATALERIDFTILVHVRHDDQFVEFRMAVFFGHVNLRVAENSFEADKLGRGQFLIAEHQYAMLEKRVVDGTLGGGVERFRQVDAAHFCQQRRSALDDFHSHGVHSIQVVWCRPISEKWQNDRFQDTPGHRR